MSVNSVVKRHGWTAARAIVLAAWVVFAMALMSTVVVSLLWVLPVSIRPFVSSTLGQLLIGLIIYILALIMTVGLPYWVGARVFRRPYKAHAIQQLLGVKWEFAWKHIGLLLLSIVGYLIAVTLVINFVARFIPGYDAQQQQSIGFTERSGIFNLALAFFALVILPPVIEELLFRGYLFGELRARSGFIISALITSAIFGLVHLQWNVSIDTFVLSLFLCYLRERTGAIWMSMGLHAFKNGLAYFFLFIGPLIGINLQ